MKIYSYFLVFALFSITSCVKGELNPAEQHAEDISKIQKYLTDNKLTAKSTASGLHYFMQVEGTGANPTINSTVSVFYKGYYLDGKGFDESLSKPISFPLKNVIPGWQEGIQLFKKGGKGVLLIPSGLGYGSFPPNGVRRNAVLVFDVELVSF